MASGPPNSLKLAIIAQLFVSWLSTKSRNAAVACRGLFASANQSMLTPDVNAVKRLPNLGVWNVGSAVRGTASNSGDVTDVK